MNPIEQRIRNAAPAVDIDDPSVAAACLQVLLIPSEGPEQIVPGNGAAYRAAASARVKPLRPGPWNKAIPVVLSAAILMSGIALSQSPHGGDLAGAPAGLGSPEPGTSWRTVTVTRPWGAGPQISASFELPTDWQVRRHRTSDDFPGLHASVRDQDGLMVAMLYLGPAPEGTLTRTCRPGPADGLELERIELLTGAERLNPNLRSAFSYSLRPGTETRGTFGLVPAGPGGTACAVHNLPVRDGQLILQFGDALRLPVAGAAPVPHSGYARTFAAGDQARGYLASKEYSTLRRIITSLHVDVPDDVSALWDDPSGHPPGPAEPGGGL